MEVSSQALKYDRVHGVEFGIGVYLNIGEDHISDVEHPDFDDYFNSKMKIFSHTKRACVSLDTLRRDEVLKRASVCDKVITFSMEDESADIYVYSETEYDIPYTKTVHFDQDIDQDNYRDEETGEVDETEIALFTGCDMEWVVNWLLDCYESYNN